MKKVKKTALLLAMLVITVSLVLNGCGLVKQNPQAAANAVVAEVGGEKINKAEFDQMWGMVKVQYEAQFGAEVWDKDVEGRKYIDVMKEKVLDALVDIKVQEQEAIRTGITASDDEINAEVDKARQYFDSEQKFNEYLASQKITLEALKGNMRKDILVRKLQEKLTADVQVTDDEIAAFYTQNQAQFVSVKASHILLEDEEEAKKMLERVKKGENINELALQYSKDPTAKDNKGDLGYFRKGEMVEEFDEAVFKLKPGDISDLVKTKFGFHIIKLEDKKYDRLEDIKEELKLSMTDEKKGNVYKDLLTEMRTKANIKKNLKNL